MKIIERKIDELVPADYNPRKISLKQMEDLKTSIKSFGVTEPALINMHSTRLNVIISGHQRIQASKELEHETMPCVEVKLTLKKEKELNIRMNKAGGRFENSILEEFFEREDLKDWGFMDSDFPEDLDDIKEEHMEYDEPVYPIVPKFSEKYDYVIIVATNEIDIAYLENFFQVGVEKSYKKSTIGVGRVVTLEKFKKIVGDERVG